MSGIGTKVVLSALCGLVGASAQVASAADKPAERQGGALGVGVVMGDVDGFSLKRWFGPDNAIHVRLGTTALNSVSVGGTWEHHWRPFEVTDGVVRLPLYVGVGGRFKVAGQNGATYMDGALVGVGGLSVMAPELPVELFFEVLPSLALINPSVGGSSTVTLGFEVQGNMGVHYYF